MSLSRIALKKFAGKVDAFVDKFLFTGTKGDGPTAMLHKLTNRSAFPIGSSKFSEHLKETRHSLAIHPI
jgi:hypothetical protein